MATGGRRIDFGGDVKLEMEYNTKLYKEMLPIFVEFMPAVLLTDQPCINRHLHTEVMEKVKCKKESNGPCDAARLLLDNLRKYPGFFDSILEAMDNPSLKLTELKSRFLSVRERVDTEWLQQHPVNNNAVLFRPPTQDSMGGGQVPGMTRSSAGPPASDFMLNLDTDAAGDQTSDSEDGQALDRNEYYMDATSRSEYATASSLRDEHMYDQLVGRSMGSLQVDAIPEGPLQETGEPAQASAVSPEQPEASPIHLTTNLQIQPRRPPQLREDHPSLRRAISNNPVKDFDDQSVSTELSSLPGWSSHQEEQQVIRSMRKKRDAEGTYIIWYWSLAKRPTVCVICNRKELTFVIHKSASSPGQFYINKSQQKCRSLRELITYHILNGILCKTAQGEETTVFMTTPYSP